MSVVKSTSGSTDSWLAFTCGAAYQNLCQSGHPFTFAVVAEISGTGAQDLLYAATNFPWSGNVTGGLGESTTSGAGFSDNTSQIFFATSPVIANTKWYILVATNTTPGTANGLALYAKNITDNTAWQISGALTGQAGISMSTAGHISIGSGNIDFGNIGASWALAAVWANVALTSTQAQALSTNKATSDWWNNAGGQPDFLVECTTLTPTDIGQNPTAFNTSSNLSLVADTSGWTYDGRGTTTPAPAPAPRRMPLGV